MPNIRSGRTCQKCNGEEHSLCRGAEMNLWMKGNVIGCSTSGEDVLEVISCCPYCGRNLSAMGGLKKNAPKIGDLK